MNPRRLLLLALTFGALALSNGSANAASDEAAWNALRAGGIAIFRHSNAPGVGDPPGMRLDDCSTQRNLDEEGRVQARRIGDAFRSRNIQLGAVLASQWCRATETAELAFRSCEWNHSSTRSSTTSRRGSRKPRRRESCLRIGGVRALCL